jgi:hypothetical protein
MSDIIVQIDERTNKLQSLLNEMRELAQPRSNFALRHFVVAQHDTPARQRQQVLLELQGLMFELADRKDEIVLLELDIEELNERLEAETNPRQQTRLLIEQAGKRRRVESLQMLLDGRLRECDTLYAMLDEIPKVDNAELERQEADYWSKRLTRQYMIGQRDVGGNLNSMMGILTELGKPRPELAGEDHAFGLIGLSEDAVKRLR